ncbi:MAG: potassium channel protein [Candidatus Nezhaarchaeota archaeon]|nr:potassium channel protein [Candidatus Nezhaarchaeota archaeon]MCX8141421.1 potassium channel protein [Candidatus Nezhaarchaeota archaeon]MDW8049687.1 TrkA C-terminal domain-containing protein [Nitrososphaerota archaeon]
MEEPRSVRELLIEIKNITERIVDLAFSSLMFNLEDVAREVLRLEERIDDLLYMLFIRILMASETARDAERLAPILAIASAMENIANAAGDLAAVFLKGFKLHPVVYESLKEVEERVVSIKIKKSSKLAGKRISDISEELGVAVVPLVICRSNRRMINPPEDFILEPGDALIVKTVKKGVEELRNAVGE